MIFLAFLGAIVAGIVPILSRKIGKNAPVYGFILLFLFFGTLFTLPLFLRNPVFPNEQVAWLLLATSVAVWTAGMLLNALAIKHTHTSIRTPLMQTQLFWFMFFAFIILREEVTWMKVVAAVLVFTGGLLITVDHIHKPKLVRGGVIITLITAFTFSIAGVIEKSAMVYFTPGTYNFLSWSLLFIIFLVPFAWYVDETKKFFRVEWRSVAVLGFFSVISDFIRITTYQYLDLSVVTTIFASSTIVAVLGAMFFFREERTHVARKLISTVLVVAGATLAGLAA
jgi:drug/metabolite transporter (DMT)-like permease